MSRPRRRRDAQISREGSVHLRRALLGLGIGLRQKDPAARTLRERGKPGGIIACALTHRAGKIAFAMVRDHAPLQPGPLELTRTFLHSRRHGWQAWGWKAGSDAVIAMAGPQGPRRV